MSRCEHEVNAFCDTVCEGLQCTPELNTTYQVRNMGCFNDTGSGPDFDGACGFVSVGSGCEGDKPCKGNRFNNSWEFAAQTCNRAGFSIAAVVDGLGAEIFCTLHDGSLDSLAFLDPLALFGFTCHFRIHLPLMSIR